MGGIRVDVVEKHGPCMQVAPGTLRIFQPFALIRDRGKECRRDDGRGVGWVSAGAGLALGVPRRSSLSSYVVLVSSANSSVATPSTRTRLFAERRTTSSPMTANRSQVRAALATTTP